jgi:hypothetical protein
MANVASPYGLVPVNLLGGRVYSGSTRMLPIASGSATSIFFGDVVKPLNTGFIDKDTGTSTLTPAGVFLGVNYVDPTYGFTTRQMWTGATVTAGAAPAVGVVCDDPFAVFRIQGSAAMTQTMLFNNFAVVQGSGSTISGDSGVSLNVASADTTPTLPLRLIGWVGNNSSPGLGAGTTQECVVPGDLFPDCLVMFNFGTHMYLNSTGT